MSSTWPARWLRRPAGALTQQGAVSGTRSRQAEAIKLCRHCYRISVGIHAQRKWLPAADCTSSPCRRFFWL